VNAILCRGFRLIDPTVGLDRVDDVLVVDGRVTRVGPGPTPPEAQVVDGRGRWLVPGLVDVHVHLRTPGETHKETLASGLAAAWAGGFTRVGAMANTRPPVDTPEAVAAVVSAAPRLGVRLHQYAAATVGLGGEVPTDYAALRAAGVLAVSDDGRGIQRAGVMRRVLAEAGRAGLLVIAHEEDDDLSGRAPLHLGEACRRLGLPGQPPSAEAALLARDVVLLDEVGGRLHVAHVSTRATLAVLRWAKARGLPVTAEVTPHHLFLDETAVLEHGATAKMNPPLRAADDRAALVEALVEGLVDAVATDHAPHTAAEKAAGLAEAPFGIVGLETAVGLVLDRLVRPGRLAPAAFVERMSVAPRRILGLPPARMAVGEWAEFTAIDPEAVWTVRASQFATLARHTPFEGFQLVGRPVGILTDGEWRPWSGDLQ
jgi:dihydroorotase